MKITFRGITKPPSDVPPSVLKVREFCDGLGNGYVIDAQSVAAGVKCHISSLRDIASLLGRWRHKVKNKCWYGNPRTIAELKKQFP